MEEISWRFVPGKSFTVGKFINFHKAALYYPQKKERILLYKIYDNINYKKTYRSFHVRKTMIITKATELSIPMTIKPAFDELSPIEIDNKN